MSLVLEVLFGDKLELLHSKKMSFPFDGTIYDILMAINEKVEGIGNLEEYALFKPVVLRKPGKGKNDPGEQVLTGKGQWLIPKRTIESYGLLANDRLWFRKKMNVVKVLFPDGSTKSLILDVCQSIKGLLANIASKKGLHHVEAFGIKVAGTNKFLNLKKFLYEVADPEDVITLCKRHFIQEGELTRDDEWLLDMSYMQAHEYVVKGSYPTNRDEIVRFGALDAMIIIGKFDDSKKVTSIKHYIDQMVPPMYQKKDVEKDIFNKWKDSPSLTPVDAKYKYLQLAMTLRMYGLNIYHGGIDQKNAPPPQDGKKAKHDAAIMAFGPAGLKLFTPDYKVLVDEPYEHLKSWNYQDTYVDFDFDKYNNGQKIRFYTNEKGESEDIYTLVAGYIEIITLKATKVVEEDDTQVANEVQITKEKKKAAIRSKAVRTRIAPQVQQTAEIAKVTSVTDEFQANKAYALPVNFAVDIKDDSKADDDRWRSQLRDQSDKLLGLLKPLSESLRSRTKMSDEDIKKFGFHIDGIRNAVLQGALTCEDKDTYEALSNNLMDAFGEYLDCCSLVKNDPDNASYLKALNEAEQRVQMCLNAVNAAANGMVMDLDQDVLMELANTISVDVDECCEICKSSPNDLNDKMSACRDNARMLKYAAQSMGLCLNDPACAEMFKDILDKCKASSQDLLTNSQMVGTPAGESLQLEVDDICDDCDIISDFLEEIRDDNVDKRRKYLEAAGDALQVTDWLKDLQNMRIDDVQKSTIALKKDLPIIVKYMKEYIAQPEVDDAKRQFIISNLKDITANAKVIFQNSDPAHYSESNIAEIKASAAECNEALKDILNDELKDVVHSSMFTDSKKAAVANLRVQARLKQIAKKDRKNRDRLLKAAREVSESMRKLLQPIDDEDKYIDNSLQLCRDYEQISKELDALCETVGEGRADLIEDKRQLDTMMAKLDQDVAEYRIESMQNQLRAASLDYRLAAAELKQETLTNESKAELEEIGIKEECNEEAINELNALIGEQENMKDMHEFDRKNAAKVEEFSKKANRAIRALVKASRTTKKKNERKLILDAAMKLSNDITKLLYCVDDKAFGKNELNMDKAMANLQLDEKQMMSIIKMDDLDDLETSGMQAKAIVSPEQLAKEEEAAQKMQAMTQQMSEIQAQMDKEVKEKKDKADKSEDPKEMVHAALEEAVVGMLQSSVAVMSNATQAQQELVAMLNNPNTASSVIRDVEYVDELIGTVDEVQQAMLELQDKIRDDTVSADDLVLASQNVGKKVERVVAKCRAGTKLKNKSNKYKDLLNASKLLAESTQRLLKCAQEAEEFDDTPVVINMPAPPPPPPIIEEEEDIETFGIDEYTLREIEQQKKIFELEKKLEALTNFTQ